MIPAGACLDATFRVVGPFGAVIVRFTGVRRDGRLCFEGWEPEEGDFLWSPTPEMIRECTLVAHAR